MARKGRRKWIAALAAVVVLVAAGVAVSWRGSLLAKDTKGPSADEFDLRMGKAELADVQQAVNEVGTIEPVVKVDVKSTLSGTVRQILVREGDAVKEGQTLARVEPDVNQAKTLSAVKSEVSLAEINLQKAKKDVEANQLLFEEGYLAEQQMRDLRQRHDAAQEAHNKAQVEYRIVVDSGIPLDENISTGRTINVDAPMDGFVIKRNVEVGQTVMSGVSSFNEGTPVFTVADLSAMLIKASINEVEIGRVSQGQVVQITVDAFPYRRFGGKVSHISPAARQKDKVKVFDIEVALDDQNREFRSGMTANIEIRGARVEKALAIPVEAILRRSDGEIVYVLKKTFDEPGKDDKPLKRNGQKKIDVSEVWKRFFEERKVTAGLASLEKVQILSGLTADEQVALEDPTKPRQIAED